MEIETTPTPTTPVDDATVISERMQVLVDQMDQSQKQMKLMHAEFKKLQKDLTKALKKKNTRQPALDGDGNKIIHKTGFALPVPLSAQLCEFLKLPEKSMLSRTDVTRLINSYIKEHELQDPKNGRQINPDTKLKDLLNPSENDLSYFTLQKYMKHHFMKLEKLNDKPTVNCDVEVNIVNEHTPTATKGAKKTPAKSNSRGGAKKQVAVK